MLHVGLDLSRRRVDVCLISSDGELVEHFRSPADRDGLYGLSRRVAVYGEAVRGVVESTNDRYCGVAWRAFGLVGGHAPVPSAARPPPGRVADAALGREPYVCVRWWLLGSVVLSEEATDRGPEPAERPLTVGVLAGLAALVADLAGGRGVAR
jgi:hypothetical protein